MLPDTCDVDIFEVAFANVGLCSDTVWTKNEPDIYKRVNRELWIKTNRLRKYFKALESRECTSETKTFSTRTVRDTIPFSNLAKYGNYKYDEQRENLYIPDESQTTYECICDSQNESKEPWMCPGVEEEFKRLTNASSTETKTWSVEAGAMHPLPHRLSPATGALERDASWASRLLAHYPQLATALRPGQQESLFSETELEHLLAPISQADLLNYPPPRYCVLTSEEVDLQVRVTSSAVRSIWDVKSPVQDGEDGEAAEDVSCAATSTPPNTLLQDLGESPVAEASETTAAFSRSLAMTVAVATASGADTVPVYKRIAASDGAPLRTPPASTAASGATPAPCFVATAAAAAAAVAASASSRSSRSASPEIAHFDRLIRIILDEEPYRSVDSRTSRQPVLLATDEIDWFISVYPDRYNEMLSMNNLANDILDLEQQMDDVKRYLAFPPTAWIQTSPSENELGADSLTESLLTSTQAGTFSPVPDEIPERESVYETSVEHASETTPIPLSTYVSAPELPDSPVDTPTETPAATPDHTPSSTPEPVTVVLAERDGEFTTRSDTAALSTTDSAPLNRLEARPRRRLYRDVLASAARNPPRQLPPPPPPPSQLPTPVPLLSIMIQKPVLETQPSSVSVSSGATLSKSVARASRGQKVSPSRRSSTQRATSAHKAPPRRAASAQKTCRGLPSQRVPIVQISHMAPSSMKPHDPLARDTSPGCKTDTASGAPSPAASPPATSTPLISPRATEAPAPSTTETPPAAGPGCISPRSPRGQTPPLPQCMSEPIAPNAKTQTFAEVAAGPARSRGPSPLSSPTRQGKRSSDPLDRRGAPVLSETSLQRRLEQLLKQAAEQLKPSESHALRYKEHERPAAGALVAAALAAAEQFSMSGRGGGRGEGEARPRVSALPPGGVRPPSPQLPRGAAAAASKRTQSQHALALVAAAAAAAGAGHGAAGSKPKPAAASRSLCSLAAASPARTPAVAQTAPTSPRAGALLTVEHGGGDRSTPLPAAVVPRRRLVLVCGSEKCPPPPTPLLPTDTSDSDEGGGGGEGGGAGAVCGGRRRGPRIELASTMVRHSRRLVAAVLEGSGSGGDGSGGGGGGCAGGPEGGDGAAVAGERRRDEGDDGSSAPALSAAKEAADSAAAAAAAGAAAVAGAGGATGAGALQQPPGGAGDSVPAPLDAAAAAEAQALEHHPNVQRTQVSAEPDTQSADSLNDPYGVSETWVHPSVRRGILRIGDPFCDSDEAGMLNRFRGGGILGGNDMPPCLLDCEHYRPRCERRVNVDNLGKRTTHTSVPFPRDITFDPTTKHLKMCSLNGHTHAYGSQDVAFKFWEIASQMGCGDQLDPPMKLLDIGRKSVTTSITEKIHESEISLFEPLEYLGSQVRLKSSSVKFASEKVHEHCRWGESLRVCKTCQERFVALGENSEDCMLNTGSQENENCFTGTLTRTRFRLRKEIHCIDNILCEHFEAMHSIKYIEWDRKKRKARSFEKKIRARALDLQWKDVLFTGYEVNFIRELSTLVAKHRHVYVARRLENLRRLEFLWQQEVRDSSRWLVPALAVRTELFFPMYCSQSKLDNVKVHRENMTDMPMDPPTISKPEECVIRQSAVKVASNTISVNIIVEPLDERHISLPRTVLSDLPPLSTISKLSVCTKLRNFADKAGRKNADQCLLLDILANRGFELRQERRRPFRACVILQSQALVLARNYRARMRCAVNAAVLLHIRPFAILRITSSTSNISKKMCTIKVKDVTSVIKNPAILERTRNNNAAKPKLLSVETKTNKYQNGSGEEPVVQNRNMKRSTKGIVGKFEQPLTGQKNVNKGNNVDTKKVPDNSGNARKRTPCKKKVIAPSSDESVSPTLNIEKLKNQEYIGNDEPSNVSVDENSLLEATDSLNVNPLGLGNDTLEKQSQTIISSRSATDNKAHKVESGSIKQKKLNKDIVCNSDIYGKAAGDDGSINTKNNLVWKSLFPKSALGLNENLPQVTEGVMKELKVCDVNKVVQTNDIITKETSNIDKCVSGTQQGVEFEVDIQISDMFISGSEKSKYPDIGETSLCETTSDEIEKTSDPSPQQDLPQPELASTDLSEAGGNGMSGQDVRKNTPSNNANPLDYSPEVSDKATSSETTSQSLSLATTSDLSDDGSSRGTSSFEFDDSMSFDGDSFKKFCSFTRLFRRKKPLNTPGSVERVRKRKTIEDVDEVPLPKDSCGDGLDERKKKKKDSGCTLQ